MRQTHLILLWWNERHVQWVGPNPGHSRNDPFLYIVGTYVPFSQTKPRSGLSAAVAFMQIAVGASRLCGNTSIFDNSKLLHEESVLHSMMIAS